MNEYEKQYQKWLGNEKLDVKLKEDLISVQNDAEKIREYFYAPLEFGTAGLRGIMRAGTNGMNIYTVGQATQGISNIIKEAKAESKGVVIVYDSRNNSRLFAETAAANLAANGITAYIFNDIRPTAELSFAIRHLGAVAGINITASHNPKEYNGYKAYWEDGAQLPPDYAAKVSAAINENDIFGDVLTCDFASAQKNGKIKVVGAEIDEAYIANIINQSVNADVIKNAPDDFCVLYTPIHGAGYKLVPEILKRRGLKKLLTVDEQMVIDGNFPTVKYPNPEFKEVFNIGIEKAKKENCSLLIGTDPDSDRVGIVVRTNDGDYVTLSGNQVGTLLTDYIISQKKNAGTLPSNACVIKTIVSTEMAQKVCDDNGITMMNVLTGFKFIGEKIKQFEETGEYTYLFGFEESYGYLAGTYARDKDAVVASMLIVEMAAYYMQSQNMTLYDAMEDLYNRYGYYGEGVQNIGFEGVDGIEKMKNLMSGLRISTPEAISGTKISKVRDYLKEEITDLSTGAVYGTGLPVSDVLFYELEDKSSVIIRPSGTEPKIKVYYLVNGKDMGEVDAKISAYKEAMTAVVK